MIAEVSPCCLGVAIEHSLDADVRYAIGGRVLPSFLTLLASHVYSAIYSFFSLSRIDVNGVMVRISVIFLWLSILIFLAVLGISLLYDADPQVIWLTP